MARYHMIVNSGTIPVYRRSDCSGPCGELYPGEVFVNLGVTTGYLNVNEVRFIDPDGRYTLGFINSYDGSYGNLAYSGTLQNMTNLGSCYCFRLRHGLNIVDGNNNYVTSLAAGNIVYTKSATAGASDEKNMSIIAYNQNGKIVSGNYFIKLNYAYGSMFASNFCLMK